MVYLFISRIARAGKGLSQEFKQEALEAVLRLTRGTALQFR